MATWGALVATTVLMIAAIGCGGSVLRGLRATPRPGERMIYALAIGLVVQGSLLLAASAAGWMHPAVLWAAVLLPAVTARPEVSNLRRVAAGAADALRQLTTIERLGLLIVALVACSVLFVSAMAPVSDWDSQMYHVRLPEQFLAEGRLFLPADGNHLSFLGLIQFLYLPLLAIGADAGPALVNAALTLVLGVTLAIAGSMFFSVRSGAIAAIVMWGSSAFLIVGATPRVDVALACVLAITHVATLRAFDDDAAWALPVAALCAGAAFAIKYHALPYVGMLAVLLLVAAWRQHASRRATVQKLAVTVALAMCVITPWLLKNVVFFGSALYPLFSAERLAPFLAEIVGSPLMPPDIPAAALNAIGSAREPITLKALLLRPAELSVELEARAFTRNPVFALLPLALLFWRDIRIAALAIPGLAYLAFLLGWYNHTNLRYLIPALPMLALCSVETGRRLADRLSKRGYLVLAPVALLIAATGLLGAASHLLSIPRAQVALGLWQRETLLLGESQYAVSQMVTQLTPPSSRTLMLFEARGLYYERVVLQDNLLTNWTILDHIGATDNCLAGTGITHVLLNEVMPAYYASRGADLEVMGWNRFPAFAQRCLEPLGAVRGEVLFRLRQAAGP